jgi:hypothetical protein
MVQRPSTVHWVKSASSPRAGIACSTAASPVKAVVEPTQRKRVPTVAEAHSTSSIGGFSRWKSSNSAHGSRLRSERSRIADRVTRGSKAVSPAISASGWGRESVTAARSDSQ